MLMRGWLLCAAGACAGAVTTSADKGMSTPSSESGTSAGHSGVACPGIPVAGDLVDGPDDYGPYQQQACEDEELGSAHPVCAELFGTDRCPTLRELVEITDWFGDSAFQNRALYMCDFLTDGPDIDEAYFDQPVGSSRHHWAMVFDHATGVMSTLSRNAVFADGSPEDKLCCEGVLVDIASYHGDIQLHTAGCNIRVRYRAEDFGLSPHTGMLSHSGAGHTGRTHSGAR